VHLLLVPQAHMSRPWAIEYSSIAFGGHGRASAGSGLLSSSSIQRATGIFPVILFAMATGIPAAQFGVVVPQGRSG